MIETLGLAIREGFGLVLTSLMPLFAVAAGAAVIAGLLGGAVGLRDAAVGQIVRALAVILALGMVVEAVADNCVAFARESWSTLR